MQGLFIAILQVAGSIQTVEDGKNLQNFLICLEMLPAALGMLWAFPYTEYMGTGGTLGPLLVPCLKSQSRIKLTVISVRLRQEQTLAWAWKT